MRKLYHLLLLLPILALGQTGNYVKTVAYKVPTATPMGAPSIAEASVNVTYLDGLGRPIQNIAHRESASGKDIITHVEYDRFGRQVRDYLPYASQVASLAYRQDAKAEQSMYGPYAGNAAYSESRYEQSPMARPIKQSAPGTQWAMPENPGDPDHTINTEYRTNSKEDYVVQFEVGTYWDEGEKLYHSNLYVNRNSYPAGQLYKKTVRNENWSRVSGNNNTTEEFQNKQGQVILSRAYNGGSPHDTYYVYDAFGNLSFTVPPKANGSISEDILQNLCYQYRYDRYDRLVAKKLPGKQWEYIVYDRLNRIVATGPVLSPFSDVTGTGWNITKYDVFGRAVLSAWLPASFGPDTRATLQGERDNQVGSHSETKIANTSNTTIMGVAFRYTSVAWPVSGYHTLSVSYFDDYNFPDAPAAIPSAVMPDNTQEVYYNNSIRPKGMPTGSWIRILTSSAFASADRGYVLYNRKMLPVRAYTKNYLDGYTQNDTKVDFSGKTLYTVIKHRFYPAKSEITVRQDYTYSDQGRVLLHTHKVNSKPTEMLSSSHYDELGRITSKGIGNTADTPFQKVDYGYNIRGWLKGINDVNNLQRPGDPTDLFAFKINYEVTEGGIDMVSPLYNGNISETYWKSSSDNILRKYGYSYDGLNRMTEAFYQKPDMSIPFTGSYNERLEYDKNGNITALHRNGDLDKPDFVIEIDALSYSYDSGNRLLKVTDDSLHPAGFRDGASAESEFLYNDYGSLEEDMNKGISSIQYNHQNLPVKIVSSEGTIEYVYDASGAKRRKTVFRNSEPGIYTYTDYVGGFQYENDIIRHFPTAEGYVANTSGTKALNFAYVYNFTDHLGNIRLSYAYDPAGDELKIMEENHYYPFGLKHDKYNVDAYVFAETDEGGYNTGYVIAIPETIDHVTYKYKFNGQEWQNELGLNTTAMDFRQYDNALGRFNGMDLLTEKYSSITPYNFSFNSPLYWADPTGLDPVDDWPNFLQAMWYSTASGSNSTWINDGTGNYDSSDGMSFINRDGGFFLHVVSLPQATITVYRNNWSGAGALAQMHVYLNSSFYDSFWIDIATENINGFQREMDGFGALDPTGVIDGLNAVIYSIRGQQTNAAIAALGIIPYVGDAAKVGKYGNKLSSQTIKYQARVVNAADKYHNFPVSFDKHIIQNGSWSQRIKDGADWFELPGSINGTNGTYQLGINSSNEVFHKAFIPIKNR